MGMAMAGKKSQYACLLPILAMMSIYSRAYAVAFNTDFLAGDSKNADMSRFYRASALPLVNTRLMFLLTRNGKAAFPFISRMKERFSSMRILPSLGFFPQ